MNAFTKAVTAANIAGSNYGVQVALLITRAQFDDADKETVLAAAAGVNRMLGMTRRSLDMLQAVVKLRNTAQLTFEGWYTLFVAANPIHDSGCEEFNKVLAPMYEQIEHGAYADKLQYFWDEAMPAIYEMDNLIPMLTSYLQDLAIAKQVIDLKRRKAM